MNYLNAVITKTRRLFFVALFLCSQFGFGQQTQKAPDISIPPIMNGDEIAKELGVAKFKGKTFGRKIKVAILDNGFRGYEKEKGKSLPKDIDYDEGPKVDDQVPSTSFHGLFMAQLVTLVLNKSGATTDYEIKLFNTFGITKLEYAVEKVVEEKFDVVLYSQVWEYGGNGDGKGFINALVNKALAAGVIWINAAGNFSHRTFIAPVDGKMESDGEWVVFKDAKGKTEDGLKITCALGKKEQCDLRLVLAWNDFKEDSQAGTDKDLDLYLFRGKTEIASSKKNQMLSDNGTDKQASLVPRELIEMNDGTGGKLNPGTYTIRVKIKSKNFSASQDQLRITAMGNGISLAQTTEGETLLPPADNPNVIAVGASDDQYSSVSKKTDRPDVSYKSSVALKGGATPYESSNAAAFAAGLTTLYLGTGTEKTREAVLAALKSSEPKREPTPLQPSTPTPKIHVAPPPEKKPSTSQPQPQPQPTKPQSPSHHTQGQPHANPPQTPPQQQGYPQGYPPQSQSPNGYYQYPPGYGQPQPPQNYYAPYPNAAPPPPPPQPPVKVCLRPVQLPALYPAARDLLMRGGAIGVALRNGRAGILVNYNFAEAYRIRLSPGERIFMTPRGPVVLAPPQLQNDVPISFYEIVMDRIPLCENSGPQR